MRRRKAARATGRRSPEPAHHYFGILVNQTAGLSIGTTFTNMDPVLFKGADGAAIGQGVTFSGVHRDSIKDDDSFDGMICWRASRPLRPHRGDRWILASA